VFFDSLGVKWWYEPEGFALRFDYEEFAAGWDMTEEELLSEGVPQTFKHLDGKEYPYLPDFYLPELNYWLEIKGPNPTREELEKAFMLNSMARDAATLKIDDAAKAMEKGLGTEDEITRAFDDLMKHGTYICYGDIPWPYPQRGNIFGYGARHQSGSYFFGNFVEEESQPKEAKYRSLLMGQLKLCWQECPLCLKIGVGEIGRFYCRSCHDSIAKVIFTHLVEDWGKNAETPTSKASEAIENIILSNLSELEKYEAVNEAAKKLLGKYEAAANLSEGKKTTKSLMNQDFFTSGHKSPKLQKAYATAKSARFEHGESP
jgi:hypothetical protein